MAELTSLVRLEKEFDIEVDWRGFELHPETPAGGIPMTERYPIEHLQMRRERMNAFAASFGIFDMKPSERLTNTRRVLAMAEYARSQGKLDRFRRLAMEAKWKDGKDLEDIQVLRELAAASGLDAGEAVESSQAPEYLSRVDALKDEAHRMGIDAIPTFIIGRQRIVGCEPYQELADALLRAGAAPRKAA